MWNILAIKGTNIRVDNISRVLLALSIQWTGDDDKLPKSYPFRKYMVCMVLDIIQWTSVSPCGTTTTPEQGKIGVSNYRHLLDDDDGEDHLGELWKSQKRNQTIVGSSTRVNSLLRHIIIIIMMTRGNFWNKKRNTAKNSGGSVKNAIFSSFL